MSVSDLMILATAAAGSVALLGFALCYAFPGINTGLRLFTAFKLVALIALAYAVIYCLLA